MKIPRLSFSLTQMEYVLALQKHLNFAKAARECFVTQPSLSMQISKLENTLGFEVFDRSQHCMTDAGEIVAKQAWIVLQECLQIEEIHKNKGTAPSGTLRLGVIPTIAPFLLPLFLGSFLKAYPAVTLEIEEITTQDLISKLLDRKLDVGIFSTPMLTPGLVQQALYNEPFVLCVPRNHPLAKSKRISVDQLPADEMLLLDSRNCFRDQVIAMCDIFGSNKKNAQLPKILFQAGQLETLRHCVAKGLGITMLPKMMVNQIQEDPGTGPVRYLEFPKNAPSREVSLLHNNSWMKSGMTMALLSEIRLVIKNKFK